MHSVRPISLKLGPSMVLLVLAAGWTGCDGWPRYANKPATDADALSPGASASNGVTIEWDEPAIEAEDGIGPGDATTLGLMDGIVHSGEISGLGWDADASVERLSACDNTLAFPPDAPGTYTGDVDWITVEAQETGVLCFSLKTDPSEGGAAAGARLDAVLYDLDECDEPVALYVEDGTSTPIGVDLPLGTVEWAIGIKSGTVASVGIAGFWPDDDELTLSWTAHLALVPGVAEAPSALCPEVEG